MQEEAEAEAVAMVTTADLLIDKMTKQYDKPKPINKLMI
jgi:hypothetical protein